MRSQEAEGESFRRLHAADVPVAAGVHLDLDWLISDHVKRAWAVFKEFGRIPAENVSAENDALLFEAGVHDFEYLGGPAFHFLLTRQLSIYSASGDDHHMEQLHCGFLYELSPELAGIPAAEVWSFDLPVEDFFLTVENSVAFRRCLDREMRPTGTWVE